MLARTLVAVALPLLLTLDGAQPQSPSEGAAPARAATAAEVREAQREVDLLAYETHREFLAGLPVGTWIVIAEGTLRGTFEEAEAAWACATALPDRLRHALVYRRGIDDQPGEVTLSPFLMDAPHWTQAGRSLASQWELVMLAANGEWRRGGRSVVWGTGGGWFELVGTNRQRRRVPGVVSALVKQDLTLTHGDAEELDLFRFQAPVPCTYGPNRESCPRVLVGLEVPELEIRSLTVGAVLPRP